MNNFKNYFHDNCMHKIASMQYTDLEQCLLYSTKQTEMEYLVQFSHSKHFFIGAVSHLRNSLKILKNCCIFLHSPFVICLFVFLSYFLLNQDLLITLKLVPKTFCGIYRKYSRFCKGTPLRAHERLQYTVKTY